MAINEILRFPIKRGEGNKKVSFWNHTRIWPSQASPPKKNISPLNLEDFTFKTEEDFPLFFSRDFHFLAASSLYDDYFPKNHRRTNNKTAEKEKFFAHRHNHQLRARKREGEKRRKLSTLDSAYIYTVHTHHHPISLFKEREKFLLLPGGRNGGNRGMRDPPPF